MQDHPTTSIASSSSEPSSRGSAPADVLRSIVPLLVRVLVVSQLAQPAFSKFYDQDARVAEFAGFGVGNPELLVPVVGTFECLATVALVLGAAGRLAVLPLLPIMLVAMNVAGADPANVTAFLGALVILALGTGALSLWQPERRWLARLRAARR